MYNKLPLKNIGITSEFGMRVHPISGVSTYHYGLDLGWTKYQGEPVLAVHDAKVVYEGYDSSLGNHIVLKYTESKQTIIVRYLHLKNRAIIKKGTKVSQGEVLGYMGDTGYANGVHLHFEYWICPNNYSYKSGDVSKYAKNPLKYCYLFDDQTVTNDSSSKVTKVIGKGTSRNESKNQLQVIEKSLRCRKTPSLEGKILGYINLGYFNIIDSKKNDGYTWYKIGENKWVAYVKDTVKLYLNESKKEEKTKTSEIIKNDIKEEIKEEQKTNQEDIKSLNKFISEKNDYYYIYLKKGETMYYPKLKD